MHTLLAALLSCAVLVSALPAWAGTLRVVTLQAPPYAFVEERQVVGIAVDLVREGLQRMGHDVVMQIVPWKRALHMVEHGEADAIFNAVRTPEREVYLYFPDEVLLLEQTVGFKRNGARVELAADMSGAEKIQLGVGSGFRYGPAIDAALQRKKFARVESAQTIEKNIEKLLADRINVFLADRLPAEHSMDQLGVQDKIELLLDDKGMPIIFGASKSYLAFSRVTTIEAFAHQFSSVLLQMKQDGTYQKIVERY